MIILSFQTIICKNKNVRKVNVKTYPDKFIWLNVNLSRTINKSQLKIELG